MTAIFPLSPGLTAVVGGDQSGKTSLLRRLSGDLPALPGETPPADAQWLDLALPACDAQTPLQVWAALQARCPGWNSALHQDLTTALGLVPHQDKALYMLSTGSRRKVAMAGLLACGAAVTCLDQPFAALDGTSIRVVLDFLYDMADHPTRSWLVADYAADPRLPWRRIIALNGNAIP